MIRDSHPPDEPTDNTLPWQAFRYIANEMSESEQTQFERLLQDDESLQQAVVDVVHQTQLIAATQTTPAPCLDNRVTLVPLAQNDESLYRRRHLTGLLFAIAASVALIVFGWNYYSHQDDLPLTADGSNATVSTTDNLAANRSIEQISESDYLAIVWADTPVSVADDEFQNFTREEFGPVIADEETENWMFAALMDQSDASEVLQ